MKTDWATRHAAHSTATLRKVHDSALPIETFLVKQHWHARYHQDPGNRWLRSTISMLFQGN